MLWAEALRNPIGMWQGIACTVYTARSDRQRFAIALFVLPVCGSLVWEFGFGFSPPLPLAGWLSLGAALAAVWVAVWYRPPLLGVGLAAPDCGSLCAQTGASNPGLYYNCPSSGCTVNAEAVVQQVQNPVTMFGSDNNGVIVELPAVSAPAASLNGSLVFGIGTQSNNGLNGATVYTGSINATTNSMDNNRELGLLYNQLDVAQRVTVTYEQDWAAGHPA